MYGCESWTVKKAERRRIDAFKLWCWRRLLRAPWTARRSNKSILKKIIPEYSLKDWHWSWSSSSLANWCEELTHLKRPWCWERLKARGEGNYGKTTRCLFEALRKQQEIQFKVTRVHGLISWGQWDPHEHWEGRRCRLGITGQLKLECCLCTHWLFSDVLARITTPAVWCPWY